jgi:hypothetical protein
MLCNVSIEIKRHVESSLLNFETLITFHKQEGSDHLIYLTIIFSVIFGILGYVGSAKRIKPQVRIVILFVFSVFIYISTSSFLSSLEIHDALHIEIRNHVKSHCKYP